MADNAKKKLVDVIDREAFQPVMSASANRYDSDSDKRLLEDVKAATRRTQRRYRQQYTSAQEVYNQYRNDLSSDEAKEVESQLRRLDLPTLRDVEPDVEDEAERIGIR